MKKKIGDDEFYPGTQEDVPPGWSTNVPLPTLEEIRKGRREAEQAIVRMTDDLKGKLGGITRKMLDTIINI